MTSHQHILAIFSSIGPWEMVVIGLVALLIFGRRLPEVGRSLGRSIIEFKKGLKETGDEVKQSLPDKSDLSASTEVPANKGRERDHDDGFNNP